MWLAARPTRARLAAHLDAIAQTQLTYAEIGGTGELELPPRTHHLDDATPAGSGTAAFTRLADALERWELQATAGLVTVATARRARPGVSVLNATPGPAGLLVPCRVVAIVDEPRRRGFAYGTLPGHPLAGEERFTVEHRGDDTVVLRIRSFSRPVGLGRLAPPLVHAGQAAVNRRYARAARELAA